MRVIFMGTPEFAVPSLERLALDHEVVAVYVRPDAASGRGGSARPSAVKLAATQLGVSVRQPATLRDPETLRLLVELEADVVCVAAYGLILPSVVLDAARLGAVNVHASLLPRWRGAAPIQRALLAGDSRVGVSIMRMEEGLDTGPYCLQGSVPVDEKNAAVLTAELGELGARLLLDALPSIAEGAAVWTPQAEDQATYASKITKDDVAPDPVLSANDNLLRIRAAASAAPARIMLGGKGVTLLAASAIESPSLREGMVLPREDGVILGTASGAMLVQRVKPDGKSEMDAAAWMRGARFPADACWASAR